MGLHIIGLTGESGSGKDTAAGILTSLYGFHRVALADGVKAAFDDLSGPTRDLHKDLGPSFSQRVAWQTLGTEARIGIGVGTVYLDLLATKIYYAAFLHPRAIRRFVIPDVSYSFEAAGLTDLVHRLSAPPAAPATYTTWRIRRSQPLRPAEAHCSEASRRTLPADRTLTNDGTRQDLAADIELALIHHGLI